MNNYNNKVELYFANGKYVLNIVTPMGDLDGIYMDIKEDQAIE